MSKLAKLTEQEKSQLLDDQDLELHCAVLE